MAKQSFTSGQVLTAAQMSTLQANDYNWTVDTKTADYTLVAGDAGKRIVMNSATAKTITVDDSVFTAGDVVWIHNINTGVCTVTAGTATVNSAGSLALGQWGGGALYFTSASSAIFFPSGTDYGVASGGSSSSITVGGVNYTLLTFTTDGTLTVSTAGKFDVLLVGGGGAAGARSDLDANMAAGGGGGGQVMQTSIYLAAGSYSVDVGTGGTGGVLNDRPGGNSGRLSSVGTVAIGGGGDTSPNSGGAFPQYGSGGSGAGGSIRGSASPNKLTPLIGANVGGTHSAATNGGGGGGADGVGGNGTSTTGGAGGNGKDISTFIAGATYYAGAGGGGGGSGTGGAAGNGGVAGKTSGTGNNGVNYGAGGGGSYNATGGNGAAGVVYVRFKA